MSDPYSTDPTQAQPPPIYNPAGFAQKQVNEPFYAQAKEFLKTVPGPLKAKYDAEMLQFHMQLMERANAFEHDESHKVANIKTNNALSDILDQNVTNPAQWAAGVAQGERLIDNAPSEDPQSDREVDKQKWREKAAEVWGITQRRDNPDGLAKAAGIAPGTQAATTSYAQRVSGVEAGGRVDAKNPLSSASGNGQFIESTWLRMIKQYRPDVASGRSDAQILALRTDPKIGAALGLEMIDRYGDENGAILASKGLPVSDGTKYLAHFAGAGGAADLLRANPNTPARDVLSPNAIAANPFMRNMTAGGVISWADHKMHSAPTATGPTEQHPQYFNIIGENIDPNLKALPFEKRLQLYEEVSRNHKLATAQLTDDDIASITTTGQPVISDVQGTASAMEPERARQWLEKRSAAQSYWQVTSGMVSLPEDQILNRVEQLRPQPGEQGFATKQASYDAAQKQAGIYIRQRREDPASVADEAAGDKINPLLSAVQSGTPGAKLKLAQTRMEVQDALDIPEAVRQPLRQDEANSLAQRLTLVEHDPRALNTEMQSILKQANSDYGPLAPQVMAQVLRARGVDKETAYIGVGMMRKLGMGLVPSQSELQQFDKSGEIDAAQKAANGEAVAKPGTSWLDWLHGTPTLGPLVMGAQTLMRGNGTAQAVKPPSLPNAAQVSLLQKNPELASQFDAKFGQGAAKSFLTPRGDIVNRTEQPDGSVEITYADGWVEMFSPDGSVSGYSADKAKPK